MKYLKERDFVERSYFHILEHYLSKAVRTSEENHNKGEQEVVTDIGLSIKKYLISELKIYFPSDNILSEEVDSDNELNGRTWAIDPIDGTINFSKGSFLFGFQIALLDGVKPVLSYIFLPDLDKKFMAVDGEGAFLNDERIYVKADCPIDKAIVSIGSFSNSHKELADYEFELVKILQQKVLGIRLFGAAAVDCAAVAASYVQAHFMFASRIWDVAPGALLCKEAGAFVTKIDGSQFDINYPSYLFSSSKEVSSYFAECVAKLPEIDLEKFKKKKLKA